MSDIKLFQLASTGVAEISGQAMQIEKSLQTLFETNLEQLLGIRFLATEHSTGPVHGGRIDTLGVDEDGCPVIIEYKRAVNENVINQGLFYLDWLVNHRGDFQWLVLQRMGQAAAEAIDWSAPRVICIAGDFTRYDEHAVKQMARNIELLRYRRFGESLLMLELLHAPKLARSTIDAPAQNFRPATSERAGDDLRYASQTIAYRLSQADPTIRDVFEALRQFILSLGDDVQEKHLQFYVAFKRIKNFACVELYPQERVVRAFLKVDPETVVIEEGFTRDVSNVGHFGTGDLQVSMRTMADLERAQALIRRSYDGS